MLSVNGVALVLFLVLTPSVLPAVRAAPTADDSNSFDLRLTRITPPDLQAALGAPHAATADLELLLWRANHSDIAQAALKHFESAYMRARASPQANLLYGEAVLVVWEDALIGKVVRLDNRRSADTLKLARERLAEAVKLDPGCAAAYRELGYLIWQFGNDMKAGLKFMRKAAELAPNDPVAHERLGYVYLNPTGNAHNLARAREELLRAIRIDARYAAPHARMRELYRQLQDDEGVARERAAFAALVPAGSDVTNVPIAH